MIGTKGSYYRVEIAISDPRQRDVWWREIGMAAYKAEAVALARKQTDPARVVLVLEECVWLNTKAQVATGGKVS